MLGLTEKNLQERLRNTFRVFETGEAFEFEIPDPDEPSTVIKVTEKWIADQAALLRRDFFIPLGSSSYGNLILKRRKAEFENKVAWLRSLVNAYAGQVRENIAAKIRATRDSLVEALFPRVHAAPPASWLKHSVDGKLADHEIRQRVEKEINQAFDRVEESFTPTVTCLFKGVQYETITADQHFRERIEEYFGTEDATRLLSEYDASRAQDLKEPDLV